MSPYKDKVNLPTLDVIPNEMMTDLNMLRLAMLHGVVGDLDCTFIVT
jgi:hypothetical protein